MFQNWGFLLSEIWGLLLLAALLGLFAGWLIWARQRTEVITDQSETERLRAELEACGKQGQKLSERVAELESALAEKEMSEPAPLAAPVEMSRPASLKAPRSGKPDDLKLIKGVGPVLEELCHKLGYFHFDQIAEWTASEIAWVDENLEGFKGRVTRDEWVIQARDLAAGKPSRLSSAN
ncbi:hypothetical protein NA8A_14684 [Nitratireductor indicus C115]|uniref:NADH dehydrogenase subunit E n=1 Tax=Nitratireductor indicus C115 TaxID=1231190 RepID=K2PL55_9HYPH|nr:hypothetical protein [Nitratireductor indicus]EKF41872.1 hypothetical protein NA8A_14684 [Nitratireductor indicus C115]SFQ66432.1 Predicted 5' DNA nuclease, flap endonuclease-1-like, helix-3-turn-helix (H3TH) domain [Nitratireductor indicus]